MQLSFGGGRRAAFALALAVACAVSCAPETRVGQPCTELGAEECEGDALLRCDGATIVAIAACHNTCVAGRDAVVHEGALAGDETWQCVDGPHLVRGALIVPAGAALTIEAGALVRLEIAARINAELGARVDSLGTTSAPVLVTSDNGEKPGFGATREGGINVFAAREGEPSHIEGTIIERGMHGLGVLGLADDAAAPTVTGSTFRDNEEYGILVTCNGDPAVPDFAADNDFFGNGTADVSECNPL